MNKATVIAMGICAVFAAIVVAVTLAVVPDLVTSNRGANAIDTMSPRPTGGVQLTGNISIGGPFTLVDHKGNTVTEADFGDKYRVMFFGFTHCPDFCPTKLYHISQMLDRLPAEKTANIAPIFVTVDPARDTPEILNDYVTGFDPRFTALTGSDEQIAAAAKAFRAYYQKVPSEDPGFYNVDHSTFTYVMGPDNEFIDVISYDTSIDVMVEKIGGYVTPAQG